MGVATVRLQVSTRGNGAVIDLTQQVDEAVKKAQLRDGIAIVFVPGSTAGVTTAEFEPGVARDLSTALRRLIPPDGDYWHNRIDDNGHAHVQAALLGPSVTVPFSDHTLGLGTWQQIVLVDFDTRARQREVICQIIGE
ncbi:MAG TPA: secondary thiamine-phosphate synthase enzyme YjbQ [Methylomirabilota bacterium]|nr:secondary thiamine-phosphate synthase enzyme YjbQ [Methylomirabilota bacterium]